MRYARVICFAGMYIGLLIVEFGLASIGDLHNAAHTALRVITPIFELSLAAMICALFVRLQRHSRNFPWVALCIVVVLTYSVVYIAQCYSIYLSNNYISTLAMQNTDSKAVAASPALLAIGLGIAIVWTAAFAAATIYRTTGARQASATGMETWGWRKFTIVLAVLLCLNVVMLLSPNHGQGLEPSYVRPPMASLVRNSAALFMHVQPREPGNIAHADGMMKSGRRCFHYPDDGVLSRYPFEKNVAYKDSLPFPTRGMVHSPRNVIIFFTEGESARLFGAYGGKYPGLTPNVDRLASKSMQVLDYYNHTAPTYRGLIGQLSSGYSFAGGGGENGWAAAGNASKLVKIKRQTLATILNGEGYQTYFFSPHHENTPFTAMLKSLGFRRVFTLESIGNGLLDGKFHTVADSLDDQGLFEGLKTFLARRSKSSDEKPFFIATYNFGTHAFIDTTKYGVPYDDGKNEALNTLHNYDAALGSFLDYFYKSQYAKNTIVVFTSDHAKYPDKPYIEVAGPKLKHYFVDRIPLLIYDKINILPETYNARGRNSLALAPTLLQLLGFRKVKNSFLGRSLWEPRNFPLGFAALGDSYYATIPDNVFNSVIVPEPLQGEFNCEAAIVDRYYKLERENRLFKP